MTSFLSYRGKKNLDGRTDGRKDGGHFYSPPLGRGTNNYIKFYTERGQDQRHCKFEDDKLN